MKTTYKFRNAFLMMCLCLQNTLSYGQTKEETISWLKEKAINLLIGESNSVEDIKLESINECEFVVTYKLVTGYVSGYGGV